MHSRYSIVLCFLSVYIQASLACYPGWNYEDGRCYFFSRFKLSFYNALSYCRVYGGYLVEVDNYREFLTLRRMARHRGYGMYWIGLTDLISEGQWLQATSLEKQYFTRWYPGEPNNSRGEDCALTLSYAQTWIDYQCHLERKFICEK